jgi:hypothetical protein
VKTIDNQVIKKMVNGNQDDITEIADVTGTICNKKESKKFRIQGSINPKMINLISSASVIRRKRLET